MAVGSRVSKKLSQSALTSSLVAQVTGAADQLTQVTGIWLANNNTTTTRYVTLSAYGTAAANIISTKIELPANGTVIINDPIILTAGQILYAKQDTGTDVTMTTFGIEEALA